MADQPVPTINGNRYSWASVEIDVGGTIITDIVSIDYETKVDRKEVYPTGGIAPVGRTRGRGSHSGGFTIRKEAWRNLKKRLGPGFMEKTFQVTANYQDEGNPITTDILKACKIASYKNSHKDGTDELTVDVTLSILGTVDDGDDPFLTGKLS